DRFRGVLRLPLATMSTMAYLPRLRALHRAAIGRTRPLWPLAFVFAVGCTREPAFPDQLQVIGPVPTNSGLVYADVTHDPLLHAAPARALDTQRVERPHEQTRDRPIWLTRTLDRQELLVLSAPPSAQDREALNPTLTRYTHDLAQERGKHALD